MGGNQIYKDCICGVVTGQASNSRWLDASGADAVTKFEAHPLRPIIHTMNCTAPHAIPARLGDIVSSWNPPKVEEER